MKYIRHIFLNIRYRAEYFIVRLLTLFAEVLPTRCVYFISYSMGQCLYFVMIKKRKQIYDNLQLIYPHGVPFCQKKFARMVFAHFCYVFFEFALSNRLLNKDNWRNYVSGPGMDYFTSEMKKIKTGAILVTGHIGSFEILSHLNVYMGARAYTVMRSPKNPYLASFFKKMVQRSGQVMLDNENVYLQLKEILANGGFPTLAVDQHAGKNSLLVDFMGVKAYTAPGSASLVREFNVPLYAGALFRTGLFKFNMYVEKVKLPSFTDDKQKDLENITLAMNDVLAKFIRMYPEQWFWMHRRWRSKDGKETNARR